MLSAGLDPVRFRSGGVTGLLDEPDASAVRSLWPARASGQHRFAVLSLTVCCTTGLLRLSQEPLRGPGIVVG